MKRRRPSARQSSGYTLVELVIAITMSSLVVAAVFYSWAHIQRSLADQKRKTGLEIEARVFGKKLINNLDRAKNLVYVDEYTLTYISDSGKEMTYEFIDGALHLNESPLKLPGSSSSVTQFGVNAQPPPEDSREKLYLITLTITITDDRGYSHTINTSVSLPAPDDEDEISGGESGWNW